MEDQKPEMLCKFVSFALTPVSSLLLTAVELLAGPGEGGLSFECGHFSSQDTE